MAVHAQFLAHAFPHDHDPGAILHRPAVNGAAAPLGGPGCGDQLLPLPAAVLSDLTCVNVNHPCYGAGNNGMGCQGPRKRARVTGDAAGADLIQLRARRAPLPVPQALAAAADDVLQAHGRVLCSAAASTSGRPATYTAPASQDFLLHLDRHGAEIDALVRAEAERLRAGLEEAARRHARAVLSAVGRAAARRLRAAEAGLGRALARNAELGERLRQAVEEAQAWRAVASGHEAAAAGLRATLDRLLQPPPCAEGEAEDARSCCFEQDPTEEDEASRRAACRSCGAAEARVLVLPCRHLCLCAGCEAAADACPVCAAAKNASLHVLLA